MSSQKTGLKIISYLNALYPNPQVPLNHTNDFTLLVAVLLSAQSTDKKVNEVTPALFELGSDPKAMSKLGEKKILFLIKHPPKIYMNAP